MSGVWVTGDIVAGSGGLNAASQLLLGRTGVLLGATQTPERI